MTEGSDDNDTDSEVLMGLLIGPGTKSEFDKIASTIFFMYIYLFTEPIRGVL